jgi:anti-sigma factor ChrR (cupin superfamily)
VNLHAEFDQRAVVHAASLEWVSSPTAGVDRRMLDRIGDEVARATSIVRYAPDSEFPAHLHGGGEEILVLEGVFQDEHGDFPAGSYIRNPPGSRHTPGSAPGCVILVKLWQFDLDDRTHVRIDTNKMASLPAPGRPGVAVMPLFQDGIEDVRIESWEAEAAIELAAEGGLELLVLDGSYKSGDEEFVAHSWQRLPDGDRLQATAGGAGCRVWVKSGHLRGPITGPNAAQQVSS